MRKSRFGNGSSRGGRSGRGKRRHETEQSAAPAPEDAPAGAAATAANGAPQPDGASGGGPAAGAASPAGGAADLTEAAPAVEGADAAAAQDEAPDEAAPAEQVEQLQGRVAALQDELLRKQADFENFRKRLNRDRDDAIKYANTGLLHDLVALLDDFERAIAAAAQSQDFASFHSGIEIIEKNLLDMLQRKWGLTRFDSAGQPFDPERHEALATAPSAEHAETTVIEDFQKGYTLHGRVIRAARVRVVTPLEGAPDDHDSAAGNGDEGSTEKEQSTHG